VQGLARARKGCLQELLANLAFVQTPQRTVGSPRKHRCRACSSSKLRAQLDQAQRIEPDHQAAHRPLIDTELWSNDIDAIYDIPLSRGINAYVMAGGGGGIRRISLTRTVGTGGPYCNDWAGFCDAGGYPGDVLVNSKTTGRWEWNAGVELSFSLGGGDAFFVEARYMEVETPVPTGFVPIRVGLLL
jgi:hypothetical protein